MALTRYDLIILKSLKNTPMTLQEIQDNITEVKISIHKIRYAIYKFLALGYVKEGEKIGERGNTKTYFITDEGLKNIY